jgi:mannose-6-phosphate isomerase-like protein (cupin superfamily)
VTAGEITVVSGGQTVVLRANDSCLIPANEARTVLNHTNLPASMVVILSKVSEAA